MVAAKQRPKTETEIPSRVGSCEPQDFRSLRTRLHHTPFSSRKVYSDTHIHLYMGVYTHAHGCHQQQAPHADRDPAGELALPVRRGLHPDTAQLGAPGRRGPGAAARLPAAGGSRSSDPARHPRLLAAPAPSQHDVSLWGTGKGDTRPRRSKPSLHRPVTPVNPCAEGVEPTAAPFSDTSRDFSTVL